MHRKHSAKRAIPKFVVDSNICAFSKRLRDGSPSNNYANRRVKYARLLWCGRLQLPKVYGPPSIPLRNCCVLSHDAFGLFRAFKLRLD